MHKRESSMAGCVNTCLVILHHALANDSTVVTSQAVLFVNRQHTTGTGATKRCLKCMVRQLCFARVAAVLLKPAVKLYCYKLS